MKRLVALFGMLFVLTACDTLTAGPPVELEVSSFGDVEQYREHERAWGFVILTFRNAGLIDIFDVDVAFLDAPPGLTFEETERKRSPTFSGVFWINLDAKGSDLTPLGRHSITVEATADGRTYTGTAELQVVPRKPTLRLEQFSVSARYQDYPYLTAYVVNTFDKPMANVPITASCTEETYPSLRTYFEGTASLLPVGAATVVRMEYSSGFPYFTGYTVWCNFSSEFEGHDIIFD